MTCRLDPPGPAAPLFDGWEETMIWSCLSGTMGAIYADDRVRPAAALAALGDFCFFAGTPCRELVRLPAERRLPGCQILVPQDEGWAALIEDCWGDAVRRSVRYAIKKEPSAFDRTRLEQAADSLPPGYRLRPMDEELFHRCRQSPWSADWTAQYQDWAQFRRHGLGMVVLKDGEPVSGASSYSGWPGGIEVEIDTRADCRRLGLAYAAGAALILACLDRGWYPSWDAQNLASVALAEKLGYHFSHEYRVYLAAEGQERGAVAKTGLI